VIDFKYHVVSIVAVFLALAVGIVLGTNVLSGDVLKNLKAETTQLRKDSQALRTQVSQQQSQIDTDQAFGAALEPIAVSGRLSHQRIAVVMLPGASKTTREQIVKTLTSAGATVTAQVELTSTYVDPTQQSTLDDLVRSVAPPTLDLTGATTVSTRAAAVTASALVVAASLDSSPSSLGAGTAGLTGPTGSVAAAPAVSTEPVAASAPPSSPSPSASIDPNLPIPLDPASVAVLAALGKAGFVKVDQSPTEFATLAVIVAPMPPTKPETGTAATDTVTADKASLDMIRALESAGSGSVVAGATGSAAAGGLIAQVRSDSTITKTVSGVDNVDTTAGEIALVYATASEVVGRPGQWGTGGGVQGPLPTPPSESAAPATPLPSS
jgi:hypothetical protein